MRRNITLFMLSAVFSVLAFAESWQGRLVDTTCYEQHKSAATCDATSTTTGFALFVSNQAFKLDDAGNAKAADAMKSRADRSTDPAKPVTTQVIAKITGTKDGENLKVETIELQ
jgi:hypothetical protein